MSSKEQIETWKDLYELALNQKQVEIFVRYHDAIYGSILPRLKKYNYGDWIDLYTAEPVEMNAGDFKLISLGISMRLPEGYEAIIAPRSSTFMKYGIIQTNSIGVIDNTYCGDNDIWKLPCYAVRETYIPPQTRLCQFRLERNQPPIILTEVEKLVDANRGGFGSTGD